MPRARIQSWVCCRVERHSSSSSWVNGTRPMRCLRGAVAGVEQPAVAPHDHVGRRRHAEAAAGEARPATGPAARAARSDPRSSAMRPPETRAAPPSVAGRAGVARQLTVLALRRLVVEPREHDHARRHERRDEDGRPASTAHAGWRRSGTSEPEVDERVVGVGGNQHHAAARRWRPAPRTDSGRGQRAQSRPAGDGLCRAAPPRAGHTGIDPDDAGGDREPRLPASDTTQTAYGVGSAGLKPASARSTPSAAGQRLGAEEHPPHHHDGQRVGVAQRARHPARATPPSPSALEHEEGAVKESPHHERPARAVPEAAQEEHA